MKIIKSIFLILFSISLNGQNSRFEKTPLQTNVKQEREGGGVFELMNPTLSYESSATINANGSVPGINEPIHLFLGATDISFAKKSG